MAKRRYESIAPGFLVGQPYLGNPDSPYQHTYCVIVRSKDYPPGRRRLLKQPDVETARLAAKQLADLYSGSPDSAPTVEQVCVAWLDQYARRMKRSSARDSGMRVHGHLIPMFPSCPVTQLTSKRIWDYVMAEIETRQNSPAMARACLSALRRACNLLWEGELEEFEEWEPPAGRLGRNPSKRLSRAMSECVRVYSSEIASPEAFTLAEMKTTLELAKADHRRIYPLLLVAFTTGMRSGEIRALHWDDIDLELGTINLVRNLSLDKPSTPKNGTRRTVSMPKGTVEVLRAMHAKRYKPYKLVFPTRYGKVTVGTFIGGLMQRLMTQAIEAGVRDVGLTFHSARHTFVSQCRMGGVPDPWIEHQVGQRLPMIRHYTHMDLDQRPDFSGVFE